jgi:hypothetical protein
MRLPAHIELENARDHDHRLRPVPALEQRKFYGFGAVDKEASAKTLLILNDPVAAAVLADEEERQFRVTRRGWFPFDHDILLWFRLGNTIGSSSPLRDEIATAEQWLALGSCSIRALFISEERR